MDVFLLSLPFFLLFFPLLLFRTPYRQVCTVECICARLYSTKAELKWSQGGYEGPAFESPSPLHCYQVQCCQWLRIKTRAGVFYCRYHIYTRFNVTEMNYVSLNFIIYDEVSVNFIIYDA